MSSFPGRWKHFDAMQSAEQGTGAIQKVNEAKNTLWSQGKFLSKCTQDLAGQDKGEVQERMAPDRRAEMPLTALLEVCPRPEPQRRLSARIVASRAVLGAQWVLMH
jgi:hypothetical protein